MKRVAIHPGHNATVALFDGGRVEAVLSQERIDSIKNSATFPIEPLRVLLNQAGWSIDEIEEVCIAGRQVFPLKAYQYLFGDQRHISSQNIVVRLGKVLRDGLPGRIFPKAFERLRDLRARNLKTAGEQELLERLDQAGLGARPVIFVEHHECHARSAYHALERAEKGTPALIFTMDGSGDGLSATVTVTDGNGYWERIAATPPSASLGGVYSSTTRFLGMKILEHEYKVMGLAPYAHEQYMIRTYERIFKPVLRLSEANPLVFESEVDCSNFYGYLVRTAVGERFDNLAAALQHLTETLVTGWIRNGIRETGIRRIFTGGGVFMNVKLNRRIQEMEEVEQVFFMPSCGDESNPIGAGYHRAVELDEEVRPLDNLYLGMGYSDNEIGDFLDRERGGQRYEITRLDDIDHHVAGMIAAGEIVGRFTGRCEWGARSLGNRAILAHPGRMESFYTVNDYIKSRDFWMPFAPSILESAASRYLQGYDPYRVRAPYMITAFGATADGVRDLRAALHQGDHTLRPQVVDESCGGYYRLIRQFEELTGIGAVLNTSLNLHGYPLASSPAQAMLTLEKSELKYLAMGHFLISKR